MGFADGHAALEKIEELWQLDWHRDWATPTTRPH
jgi:hypothetical protein